MRYIASLKSQCVCTDKQIALMLSVISTVRIKRMTVNMEKVDTEIFWAYEWQDMEVMGKLHTQHSVRRLCITQQTTSLLRVQSKRLRRGETLWRILVSKWGLPVNVTENWIWVWLYTEEGKELRRWTDRSVHLLIQNKTLQKLCRLPAKCEINRVRI
jgi:hypothetical protein